LTLTFAGLNLDLQGLELILRGGKDGQDVSGTYGRRA
jgi:hypothetical protein